MTAEEVVKKTEEKVLKTIQRYRLLKRGEKVLVGFSGGADSLCLVCILQTLSQRSVLPLKLHLCHVNHRLRPESDRDEKFCVNSAGDLGLPITVKRINLTKKRGVASNLEDRARVGRYSALASTAEKIGARKVAVGHTRDDQAETVIMRLLRGTGLRGLAGILPLRRISPESKVLVVRPLIEVTRAEILRHLRAAKLRWVEDATNRDTNFLRNRIRSEVLPQIEQICEFPIRESLARIANLSFGIRPILDARAKELAGSYVLTGRNGTVQLDLQALKKLNALDVYLLLEEALKIFLAQPTRSGVQRLRTLVEHGRSGEKVPLGSKVNASFEYNRITLTKDAQENRSVSVPARRLPVGGKVTVPELGLLFSCECVAAGDFSLQRFVRNKSLFEEAIDARAVTGPLSVSLPRTGERFTPLGAGGSNKISDFLIDKKVPKRVRSLVPVVRDENSVLWLVGQRLDERAKVNADTKKMIIIKAKALAPHLSPDASSSRRAKRKQ